MTHLGFGGFKAKGGWGLGFRALGVEDVGLSSWGFRVKGKPLNP